MNYFCPGLVNSHWGSGSVNRGWGPGPGADKYKYLLMSKFYWGSSLQSSTKYLRLTLVFMQNSVLQRKFNFCFSSVFC